MDVLAPTFAWISSLLNQVGTTVGSAANIAVQVAPSPVPIPAPSTATLGLKLLLDPAAGGIIFRAARYKGNKLKASDVASPGAEGVS